MDAIEGPFTTELARHRGISAKQLRLMTADGRVRRLFRGVFVEGDAPLTLELRASAARLVMNPHSVLCDRTAAWFHGIDVYRYVELDAELPLESFVLRGQHPTDRAECHGRTRDLKPEDVTEIGGVMVTTPLRTAVDLACGLPRREALAALDAFARQHGITVAEMRRLLGRYYRRRGVRQARSLIPLTDGRAESPPESWVRLVIIDHELPAPTPQYWVRVDGERVFRLDLAYPRMRIAVEYDGEEFHSTPRDRARDAERRAWLVTQGWQVIVLTRDSFTGEALAQWIGELRDCMRARGASVRA